MQKRRLVAIGAVVGSMVASLAAVRPAGAAVAPVDRFVLEGEVGDYIKGGAHTDQALQSGSSGTLGVFAGSVGLPDWWNISIWARQDADHFAVGLYEGAIRAAARTPGVPAIDISGEGRGCNTLTGRFRVDQADYDGTGALTAFAARFEQHCEGASAASFGTVAFHATAPVYAHQLSALSLTFADANAAAPSTQPFTITNTSTVPLPVASVGLGGADAASFRLAADACSGVTLAVGASCAVSVAFGPTTFGMKHADLVVADAFNAWAPGAVGEHIALTGRGTTPAGAVSRFVLEGETGDYIEGGRSVDITTNVNGFLSGAPGQLGVSTGAPYWSAWFRSATDAPPTVGVYDGATRAAFRAPGVPGLDVSGEGRGCNTLTGRFRVDQADYDSGGSLIAFAARFEQHCEGGPAALFGSVAFNATVPVYAHRLNATALDFAGAGTDRSLLVTNTSSGTLPVNTVSLGGADADQFAVIADGCSHTVLPAGAACAVQVALRPTRHGTFHAALTVADAFTSWGGGSAGEDVALLGDAGGTTTAGGGGELHPLAPSRLLDTRDGTGTGGVPHHLVGAETLSFPVAGNGGVPASGVSSVVVNLTATGATVPGWLALFPSGQAWSGSSSVNFPAGGTAPNMAIVALGADGALALRNCCGQVDAIVDVVGWYGDGSDGPALGYTSIDPVRAIDTRAGMGALDAGATLHLRLAGSIVPPTAAAVVVNLTATDPTQPTFITAYPSGEALPLASSLNVAAGETRPNLVTVKLGGDGAVALYNHAGRVHVIVDVVGYYDSSHSPGGRVVSGNPVRLFDTRELHDPLGPHDFGYLDFNDSNGCVNVEAAVLNVTATEPTAPSFLTVFPDSGEVPLASNLNVVAGQTIANLVMVKVPDSGIVWFYNNTGTVHVVGDLVGVVTRAAPGGASCGSAPIGAAQLLTPDTPVAGAHGVRLGHVDAGRWS